MIRMFHITYVLSLISFACFAQTKTQSIPPGSTKGYRIIGYTKHLDSGIVYLRNAEESIVDSSLIRNGQFKLDGKVSSPEPGFISIKNDHYFFNFFIENGDIRIDIDFKESTFSARGVPENDFLSKVDSLLKNNYEQKWAIEKKIREAKTQGESSGLGNLEMIWYDNENERIRLLTAFLKGRKEFATLTTFGSFFNLRHFKVGQDLFAQLPKHIRESENGKATYSRLLEIEKRRSLVGGIFPNIQLQSSDSSKSFLREYQGKVILLDFWASWCKPCIEEFPLLKTIFSKYDSPNFKILSLSVDKDVQKWHDAVTKYEIPTIQYIVKDFDAISRIYGSAIPLKILIDREGKVLLLNPTFGELDSILKSLLPAKQKD